MAAATSACAAAPSLSTLCSSRASQSRVRDRWATSARAASSAHDGIEEEIEALRVVVGERAQDARGHAGELAALGDERQGGDEVAGAVRDEQAEFAGARVVVRVAHRGGVDREPLGREERALGPAGVAHGGGDAARHSSRSEEMAPRSRSSSTATTASPGALVKAASSR